MRLTIALLLLTSAACGQSGRVFIALDSVGYARYVDEAIIDTATTEIVWDSLGYVKISRVFELRYSKQYIGGSISLRLGYDSVQYIKDGRLFKPRILWRLYQ